MLFFFYAAKACGIIGLLLITKGIFIRGHRHQSLIFAIGGIFLLVYSAYLRDLIFIVLQTVFIVSSVYEWRAMRKSEFSKRNLN